MVGAPGDDDNGEKSGSAYIFYFDGTTIEEKTKLVPSDNYRDDYFGTSVDIWGNYAIVGAHRDDDNGENSGSAYVYFFNGTTWEEQGKIRASDGTIYDQFGVNVNINSNYSIIGAIGERGSNNEYNSGAAYIYNLNCRGIPDCTHNHQRAHWQNRRCG